MKYLRSVLVVLTGLVAITVIVEPVEFLLVALVNGEFTTDQTLYLATRNQIWFLGIKLVYNFGGGVLAGLITAKLAGYRPDAHIAALCLAQTGAFLWAMLSPEMSSTAPMPAWLLFIVATVGGIVTGGSSAAKRIPQAGT